MPQKEIIVLCMKVFVGFILFYTVAHICHGKTLHGQGTGTAKAKSRWRLFMMTIEINPLVMMMTT